MASEATGFPRVKASMPASTAVKNASRPERRARTKSRSFRGFRSSRFSVSAAIRFASAAALRTASPARMVVVLTPAKPQTDVKG